MTKFATDTIRTLSDRELQVLSLVCQGRTNKEIANALEIAETTVHKHVQHIFTKLGARNRVEAVNIFNQANAAVPRHLDYEKK